jgi:hypothetical protein
MNYQHVTSSLDLAPWKSIKKQNVPFLGRDGTPPGNCERNRSDVNATPAHLTDTVTEPLHFNCDGPMTVNGVGEAIMLRRRPSVPRNFRVEIRCFFCVLMALVFTLSTGSPQAEDGNRSPADNPSAAGLDQEIQSLKQDVLALNRDLFLLEEELLFPSSTQLAVFLSLDVGEFFALDSVQLKVDDKVVTNYLYTAREVRALRRGGVQRLYIGNIKAGEHELVAFFTGKGPSGRDYRRGATRVITKTLGPRFVELKIVDLESKQQPDFEIKEWE